MRIDDYLSTVGIIKRRTVAKQLASSGLIEINQRKVKPAYSVNVGEIIEIKGGTWYHKGKELDKGTVDLIKAEAKTLLDSTLYKTLIDEFKYRAMRGYKNSKTEEDIIASKMLEYFTDIWQSRLQRFIK